MKVLLRQPLLVLLLCASVLFVRAGGVHLHLCFDGDEAPAQIHAADAGIHDDAKHAGENHTDRDVTLADGLAKAYKASVDLPALLAVVALLSLPLLAPSARIPAGFALRPQARRHWLPPAHAPPR